MARDRHPCYLVFVRRVGAKTGHQRHVWAGSRAEARRAAIEGYTMARGVWEVRSVKHARRSAKMRGYGRLKRKAARWFEEFTKR